MNMAILHHKVLGMPVWGVGLGGAAAVVIYRHFHSGGIGGAQADTTPPSGTGDAMTGDPVPVDGGTFPQTFPGASGSSGGGSDSSGFSDALAGVADAIMNQPAPPDYTQQFADLNATVGGLRDQLETDHGQNADTHSAAQTHTKTVAHKAATVHAKAGGSSGHPPKPAVSHGGRVQPSKPATHTAPKPPHPKSTPHSGQKNRNAK